MKHFIFPITLIISFYFVRYITPVFATTLPPVTSLSLSGTLGSNNWYISNVTAQLSATDNQSGVASSTYQLNNNPPVTIEYQQSENQILNYSFEEPLAWYLFWLPKYWERVRNGQALLLRTFFSPGFDSDHAASISARRGGFGYWHNRENAVGVEAGTLYTVSAHVKTYFADSPGAYLEVWSKADDPSDDTLITQSPLVQATTYDWEPLAASFTPSSNQQVYIKLILQANDAAALAYFDAVYLQGIAEAKTQITLVENGQHTLQYFSVDRNANSEEAKTASIWIDTQPPTNWQNFTFTLGQNNHSYFTNIQVQDLTSGIDVSTAEYAYYTDHQSQAWDHNGDGTTDWYPVSQVLVVETNLPAADGETRLVRLDTPEIDFGDSATVYRVRFRLSDLAGNESDSGIQSIEGPWLQIVGADLYSAANINMSVPAPAPFQNSDSLICTSGSITNFSTSSNLRVGSYQHSLLNLVGESPIRAVVPTYNELKAQALSLPGNRLPAQSGVYRYTGDYVIDSYSITTGFKKNVVNIVLIVEGNLSIQKDYELDNLSGLILLVEGDVKVQGKVQNIEGFFILNGKFYSNSDHKQEKQLELKGGVMAFDGFELERDLGRHSHPTNSEAPAEKIVVKPSYFLNSELAGLLKGKKTTYLWREIR